MSGLAPARRRVALLACAGLVVVLAAVIGTVVGRRSESGSVAEQSVQGPVVVIPGYGGQTAVLAPIVTALRRDGRDVVVFTATGHETGDLRVQAQRLGELVRRTLDRTGSRSVDLVGYSAGGVVARLYVRDDGGAAVVRRVLTLASPHHGTALAATVVGVAGGCPTACEQLAPGSELLRRLDAGDETPRGPRWVTVRSTGDQTVTPTDSAELAGALNILVQEVCPASTTNHGEIPADPVVEATLRTALASSSPRAPRGVTC